MANNKAKKDEYLKRQMELLDKLGVIKENVNSSTNSNVLISKEGADGKFYGIVQEQSNYFIKVSDSINEGYEYLGGLENKTKEKYGSYADALKRLNLKMESIRESVDSQEIKTSDIGILSEGVADETKTLLANKKKTVEAPKETAPMEEPAVEPETQEPATEQPEMEAAPIEEPATEQPEMEAAPMEEPATDETSNDSETVKEIQKLLGKLSQKLSVTDLTPSLTKNVLNTVISSTKGGIAELEDEEKEKLADRISEDGEKIEEEMLTDNQEEDIIFEIDEEELNETAVPDTWDKIEKLKEYLGVEGLLESLLRAMDDDSINSALDYIAQMNEIKLEDDVKEEGNELDELEEGVWDGVKGLFGKAKSDATESGAEIKDTVKDLGNDFKKLGSKVADTAKSAYNAVANDVKQTAGEYKKAYTDASKAGDLKRYQDELTRLTQKAKELNKKIAELGGQKRRIMNIGETEQVMNENEMTDEEYLNSPEYFIETYYNGQFGQLKEMLKTFKEQGKMEELLNQLNELELWEIKDWIIKN